MERGGATAHNVAPHLGNEEMSSFFLQPRGQNRRGSLCLWLLSFHHIKTLTVYF